MLFLRINSSFKVHLKRQLIRLNAVNNGGPLHGLVASDLAFYTGNIQALKGLESLDINMTEIWEQKRWHSAEHLFACWDAFDDPPPSLPKASKINDSPPLEQHLKPKRGVTREKMSSRPQLFSWVFFVFNTFQLGSNVCGPKAVLYMSWKTM